jgi:hypothetical protein
MVFHLGHWLLYIASPHSFRFHARSVSPSLPGGWCSWLVVAPRRSLQGALATLVFRTCTREHRGSHIRNLVLPKQLSFWQSLSCKVASLCRTSQLLPVLGSPAHIRFSQRQVSQKPSWNWYQCCSFCHGARLCCEPQHRQPVFVSVRITSFETKEQTGVPPRDGFTCSHPTRSTRRLRSSALGQSSCTPT